MSNDQSKHGGGGSYDAGKDAAGQFFQDMSQLAGNAFGTMLGARGEVEQAFKARMEEFFGGLNLVTREEFEAVQEMAANARAENEALKKRIDALEKGNKTIPKKTAAASKAATQAKTAAKKSPKNSASSKAAKTS